MSCKEVECKCQRACDILNRCLFTHPLVDNDGLKLLAELPKINSEADKTRFVLNFFHKKQPPKYPTKQLILKGRAARVRRIAREIGWPDAKRLDRLLRRD